MLAVRVRKTLAAALLLLASSMAPKVVWAGAHWLDHHGQGQDADSDRELAEVLVHGHEHADGVPDHEHRFLPSPTFRPDPPQDLDVPATAALESLEGGQLPFSGAPPWRSATSLCGSGPPRLHLLCTLLI